MKWRDDKHDDPGVDADLAELGEWGPELRALREDPRPEFLAELDKRMAPDFARGRADEQIAAAEHPKRARLRLWPALAVAAPAVAAVIVVVVLVAGSGGDENGPDKLPVAVQSANAGAGAQATGSAAAPDSAALERAGGPSAPEVTLESSNVSAGEPVVLRYDAPRATSVFVSLSPTDGGSATETRRVRLPAGSGRLRIATDDLTPGHYALVVSLPSGQSALRAPIRVLD